MVANVNCESGPPPCGNQEPEEEEEEDEGEEETVVFVCEGEKGLTRMRHRKVSITRQPQEENHDSLHKAKKKK